MTDKNLYINDLIHREATWTFTETVVGGKTRAQFKDGSTVKHEGFKPSIVDAYKAIREDYLEGIDLPFLSTTVQQAALGTIPDGVLMANKTTGRLELCLNSVWQNASGVGVMQPSAFGEMTEDSAGSSINTTTKLWDTATVGEIDANGIITFINGTNEDYLLVGANGAGTYQIHFSCTFTNAGGNVTEAGIHKNSTEVAKLKDTHSGDSAEKRDLRGQGFLVLAVNDQIKLHVVSATPADVVTIYHGHITMKRMT